MNANTVSRYLIVLGVVLLLVAIGNFSGGGTAWASNGNQGCVPGTIPCPTPTPAPGGGSGGNGGSKAPASHILGTVMDLSTNQPGAGVGVQINGAQVTTDGNGRYSLSNVAAGTYVVSLVLPAGATAAQDPVTVQVDGTNDVTVDLGYFSVSVAGGDDGASGVVTSTMATTSTKATSAVAAQLPAPQTLPETGETGGEVWFAVAGLALIFSGVLMRRKFSTHQRG